MSCMYCGSDDHNSQACPGRDGRSFAALALCLLALSGCSERVTEALRALAWVWGGIAAAALLGIGPPLFAWWWHEGRRRKAKPPSCCAWCPNCQANLVERRSGSSSWIDDDGLVRYTCGCGAKSSWDFGPPVPILIRYTLAVLLVVLSGCDGWVDLITFALVALAVLTGMAIDASLKRKRPRPEKLVRWRRAGSDYVLTVAWTDGSERGYRGSGLATWRECPSGKRCEGTLCEWLADRLVVVQWEEQDVVAALRDDHLALDYEAGRRTTVEDLLTTLRGACGREFKGYKGGLYVMGLETPIWVGAWGESTGTAIVGIADCEYSTVIETRWVP